ncbi:Flp pilus assembly protein CpaB [Nocardioides solisilvae]|uniref:Flp pilus assembly protein CpaB n=1 Tax=Nocardioides solisilvae TaxID=1542435 RepID=UPI000D750010|nr:Flp pilus assembly protein CpaB [Nocardioides solisilvae]
MDRRKLLLVVAVVVALLGTSLVYLYVQSADNRAAEEYDTVEVLTAVSPIVTGETIADAAANGKIQRQSLPRNSVLPTAVTTVDTLEGLAANTNIYPGEQILPEKFGGVGESSALPIPNGKLAVSVQLTDTARVAGFVSAGSDVAIWLNGSTPDGGAFTRLLLPDVKVLAAGSTTLVTSTSTDPTGAETTEQLPRTLLTLAVDQQQAEKIMFAAANGELSFGLRTGTTKVQPNPGMNLQNLFS